MKFHLATALSFAWSPASWRDKIAYQIPEYPAVDLENSMNDLAKKPPLVFAGRIERLKHRLGEASRGKRFLITGGDCAESFDDFSSDKIRDDLRLLSQMALVCGFSGGVPTVQIGRMAGQFAKPRSSPLEIIKGEAVPVYRGDIINDVDPTKRDPDARRMVRAYQQSAQTMNLLQAFLLGGYTKINHLVDQKLETIRRSGDWRHVDTLDRIRYSLDFFQSFYPQAGFQFDEFYTGHECLLLPYEEALTRKDSMSDQWFDCSAHFLWLGERTRLPDAAQVEFLRGIQNPIGVKISQNCIGRDLIDLLELLNPLNEPGRITLITRMGARHIANYLPTLIEEVKTARHNVLWCCDPMHGNTYTLDGIKTRNMGDVQKELSLFFEIHESSGTIPAGIHLELTSGDVAECLGGNVNNIQPAELLTRYQSRCDPRLNGVQALELAFFVGDLLRKYRSRRQPRMAPVFPLE